MFGSGDYQLDLGSFQRSVGGPSSDYVVLTDDDGGGGRERHWNDLWHFATARIANACRAALQAAAASRQLSDKWLNLGRAHFKTRIGLHTGPAVVGNVGARDRINYTLVGAVANQASRLEGLNKVYGTDILASGDVADATSDRFVWRKLDRIVTAGTTEILDVYEPLGEIDTLAQHAEFINQWRLGYAAYVAGRFNAAVVCFRAAAALKPQDGPCRMFTERCTQLMRSGLPANWDGAWHFDKK